MFMIYAYTQFNKHTHIYIYNKICISFTLKFNKKTNCQILNTLTKSNNRKQNHLYVKRG